MVVVVNQQEPAQPEETIPQGGSPESEAEISQILANTTDSVEEPTDPINTNIELDIPVSDTATSETASEAQLILLQEATVTSQGEIQTYQFGNGDVVNVMSPTFIPLVLNETAVIAREPITIGSQTGEKITVESAKDGSEVTIIHIVTEATLYDIRGSEEFINTITNYINF